MNNFSKSIFLAILASLLFVPVVEAQKSEVKTECFKTKHRDDQGAGNACRVVQDLFISQTQNVIIECDSFVDFDDRAGYTAFAQVSVQVGDTTKRRESARGPDREPDKERSKLSVYWDGEITRGVHRFSCAQQNQYADCLQTRMCIYY